ncbi:MAG TPA: hypothetical protein PLJ98_00870 [Acholeplasmataceae bacterium]|nr:hypothetical protein [Acholeplasmataceae bacterium]HRX44472.1 hypothetical protein [Acholeplasmataceae bacterium]
MYNRFRKWLSIKKNQNARGIILVFIILFNILLWLISSLIAYLIQPSLYGNVVKALWSSGITWMLEPGFYDPTVPVAIRVISIIVILLSMITFTGGIIGYVANFFSNIIDNAKQGKNKLYVYDHILILNWNYKALELIADYRYDDDTNTIVILSDRPKEDIEEDIKRKFYRKEQKKMNIIVREGEVFSKHDLMDVCIEKAKTIMILADEQDHQSAAHLDMLAMKTLMLVAHLNLSDDQTILIEVKEQKSIGLIKDYIAKNTSRSHQILPLLPDELMGRLIAQTLLMPTLHKVYHELFSFEGAEFYTLPEQNPREFMESHHKAIPIYTLNDHLYVLSESSLCVKERRNQPLHSYTPLKFHHESRYHKKHIVIFGKNQKLPYILDSIKLYERENKTEVKVSLVESNEAKDIEIFMDSNEKIDHIVILSEDHLSPEEYDSDVLLTLLMTQELAKKHHAEIIIELLDPRHYDIAQSYNVNNTIISNEYVSHMMTQLSKNRHLYDLFIDLLTYDAYDSEQETYEVYAYPAQDILKTSLPLTFKSKADMIYSFYMSGEQSYILIGLSKKDHFEIFKGDLDPEEAITIEEDDELILICK